MSTSFQIDKVVFQFLLLDNPQKPNINNDKNAAVGGLAQGGWLFSEIDCMKMQQLYQPKWEMIQPKYFKVLSDYQ